MLQFTDTGLNSGLIMALHPPLVMLLRKDVAGAISSDVFGLVNSLGPDFDIPTISSCAVDIAGGRALYLFQYSL